MVAVSKEVFQLMDAFPKSCVFGMAPRYGLKLSPAQRAFGVHPRFYPVFRRLMPWLERRFDISHIYTSLGDWHFLSALGRRPIVLTATENGKPAQPELLAKIGHVAAESERLAQAVINAGVPPERVSVIYPGVDVKLFQATPPPSSPPWRGVFASSPENPSEVHTKGVDLLLDLAEAEPEFHLTLVWRPFGPESEKALGQVRERGLANVEIIHGRIPDMERLYQQAHFTLAPFRSVGKPCPNSVLEGLACGRPALVSDYVDIGKLLAAEGAGLSYAATLSGLREAFHTLRSNYNAVQAAARTCALKHFNLQATVAHYQRIYQQLASAG